MELLNAFLTLEGNTTILTQLLPPTPSRSDLAMARASFEAKDPRDLFYSAATELVDLALHKKTKLTVAEALAVLLQTWNMAFYRFRPFDSQHFTDIERILTTHETVIARFRVRMIESYGQSDRETIEDIFRDFESILGPVGVAKCLHLLAPQFFPLWDRAIASAYGLPLQQRGTNACRYVKFLEITIHQVITLKSAKADNQKLLKALDEYNYCKYTKGWL